MNTDTGKVYEGDEVGKAKARGENLVPISRRAANRIKQGRALMASEIRDRRKKNRNKDKIQKASRKKNR